MQRAHSAEGLARGIDRCKWRARVPQKQVVRVGRIADVLKKAHEIVVLAVDVANDLHGSVDLQEGWLLGADHLRIGNNGLELLDCHVHLGARFLCEMARGHVCDELGARRRPSAMGRLRSGMSRACSTGMEALTVTCSQELGNKGIDVEAGFSHRIRKRIRTSSRD